MNHNLQIFKEKILQENLSKTETYWIDQIDFQIVDNDLNLCVNSEFVKTSIEKKVFDKILNVSKSSFKYFGKLITFADAPSLPDPYATISFT